MTKKLILVGLVFIVLGCSPNKPQKKIEDLKTDILDQIKLIDGQIAVAFLDLSNPERSVLINEEEKFHAASTMKTPVMIELFKQAAEGKFNLSDSIRVINEFKSIVDSSTFSMDIAIDEGEFLYSKIGQSVTIYDLMYDMITVSSNLATNILIQLVDAKSVTSTMRELGAMKIEVLRGVEDLKAYDQGLSNSTTAKDLLVIMQSIAESKAGLTSDCQQMIDILKDQKFNDMIPLNLPKEVEVAHKTGSITGVHHDSAIVFLPNGKSYVLVLLSKNLKDFDRGTKQLAAISRFIYDFVNE